MKIKPSWIGIFLLYICSLFYFLFQGGKASLMLFGILNGLLLYLSLGYWSGIRKIKGSRHINNEDNNLLAHQVYAGHSLQVELKLKLPSFMPTPYVLVKEQVIRHDGTKLLFEGTVVPGFRNEGTLQYSISNLKRGQYYFAPSTCLSYDVFGLKSHRGQLVAESGLQVFPQILSAKQWTELLRGHNGIYSSHTISRNAKESTQQSGVRDYVHGDRLSKIHWNATARTGQWKSKDFEREALQKAVIILDRYSEVSAAKQLELVQNRFELAVSMTASLLDYSLKNDSAIGLLSIGEQIWYSSPSSGMASHVIMMNHLVTVDSDAPKPLSQLLRHQQKELQSNNVLLIVTSELTKAMLVTLKQLRGKGIQTTLFYIAGFASPREQIEIIAASSAFQIEGFTVIEITELGRTIDHAEGSGAG